jgi:transcriptional regulator with XRE-family HTH domain
MDKSISSHDYRIFLRELRSARKHRGLTQIDLAARLGETQSFVSKCERGERRLDILELRAFCLAIGTPLSDFVRRLEEALGSRGANRRIGRN